MKISDLISNPNSLEEEFKKTIKRRDKVNADLLIDYIKRPWLVYLYARYIVGGKVENKLEDIIAQDPLSSFRYALDVLRDTFPKGENAIAQNPEYSLKYAKYLKGPFPKGEDVIATSIPLSYDYAKNVLEGPFKAGENKIATSSYYSYYYAKDVLGGPFIEGEKAIINSKWIDNYIQFLSEIGELDDFYKRHPELKK